MRVKFSLCMKDFLGIPDKGQFCWTVSGGTYQVPLLQPGVVVDRKPGAD